MYNFTDVNRVGELKRSSIQTIFNNVNLDTVVEGFRTLSVSGRGIIGQDINTSQIPAKDGRYLVNKVVDSREITVKYQLVAKSNEELRKKFNGLNILLHSDKPCDLKFTDENEYSFKAMLQKASDGEEISNSIVETITFLCLDPYKYSSSKVSVGNSGSLIITQLTNNLNEHIPELVKCVVSMGTTRVIVKNESTTKKIVLNGTFSPGDIIEIRLEEDYPVKLNGVNRSELLDFVESDFDFTVKQGQRISFSNSNNVEVYVKEKMY